MDVEYTVPGHEPLHDFELDIDALKQRMQGVETLYTPGEGVDTTTALRAAVCEHDHADHKHA